MSIIKLGFIRNECSDINHLVHIELRQRTGSTTLDWVKVDQQYVIVLDESESMLIDCIYRTCPEITADCLWPTLQ